MFTRAGQGRALWHCMWGRGLRGNSATCPAPSQHSVTSLTTHKQIGPFCCWFPGGWVCVHSRTLWISPMNSPVQLGVSPTARTPTGFLSQRFEGLFPCTGALGCKVCLALQLFIQVYPLANVDLSLCQLPPCRVSSPLWLPISTPPTGLDKCFFFNSLVVRLPYCSIFWQFYLYFAVVLLLVVWGGKV